MKNRFINDPSNKLLAMTMMLVAVITALVRCTQPQTNQQTITTSTNQIIYSEVFNQEFERIPEISQPSILTANNYIYFLVQEKLYIEEVTVTTVSSELITQTTIIEKKNPSLADIMIYGLPSERLLPWNQNHINSISNIEELAEAELIEEATEVEEYGELVEEIEVAEEIIEEVIKPEVVLEIVSENEAVEIVEETTVSENVVAEPDVSETTISENTIEEYFWDGPILTARKGVNAGPTGKETYYNLPMGGVINIMRNMGYTDEYWVREDGVKMFGDYVMVAANLSVFPRGSIVPTSLGLGVVCDTGGFAANNPTQLDIAVTW